MPALSSRHVSLSDHVKRRKSSVTLNNYGDRGGTSGSCGGSNGSSNGSNNSSGSGSNAQRHSVAQHHMLPQHHNTNNNNNNHPPISSSSRGPGQYNQHYTEGGYDSHAASYGNYDVPQGRSYGGMSGEHGSYNTENYIRSSSPDRPNRVYIGEGRELGQHRNSDPDEELNDFHNNNHRQQQVPIGISQPQQMWYDYRRSGSGSGSRQRRHSSRTTSPRQGGVVVSRQQDHRFSDPNLRLSQATTVAMGPQQPILDGNNSLPPSQQGSWDEEQSSVMQYSSYPPTSKNYGSEYSSYCPSSATVSTAGCSSNSSSLSGSGGGGGGSSSIIEEDAIRQGVIDISMLIATYLAGALSFIIGILLTLFSPLIKIIKLIVGDVRGLLGDAGFIQELGSLWRVYRDLRRRSSSDNGPRSPSSDYSTHSSRYDSYSRDSRYYDDESTVGEDSTVYTEYSPQYVGGWRPNVSSSTSAGSTMSGGTNSANSSGVVSQGNSMSSSSRRMTSRSASSLPLVHENEVPQYRHNQGQAPKSHGTPGMMYQQSSRDASYHHRQGPPPNNNNSGYNNGNYPSYQPSSQPQSPQKLPAVAAARGRSYSSSPVKQSSTSLQHGSDVVGGLNNNGYYSPQKNRRQRPGVV